MQVKQRTRYRLSDTYRRLVKLVDGKRRLQQPLQSADQLWNNNVSSGGGIVVSEGASDRSFDARPAH